jgi:dTDP-4-amino-4,6-dideoxygalactose transaminase
MNTEVDIKKKIWLSSPHMGGKEQDFINEAFKENWIAPLGPNVDGFENDISKFLGTDLHVAALSSGTAAIHLALILLGVERGDEVLCQSMTFSASANPIIYQGAKPIFVDSEADTWNMSPYWLRKAIEDRIARGKRPKAIIAVHLYGMPCQMDEIISIANEFEIPVIEDAAEALGSSLEGKKAGSFGEVSILSFNGNKIITTSGGGALVSNNKSLIHQAKFLATQARDPAPHYEHSSIGYNYRMSNICAGIGRGQMMVLNERVKKRRQIFYFYKQLLEDIPGIFFQEERRNMYSNRWLTTILLNPGATPGQISSEILKKFLEDDNIESRPLWKPMHLQPVFQTAMFYGDQTSSRLFERGLCLPSGTNMSEKEMERIKERILFLFNHS